MVEPPPPSEARVRRLPRRHFLPLSRSATGKKEAALSTTTTTFFSGDPFSISFPLWPERLRKRVEREGAGRFAV